jgi:hypothetical protein
MTRSLHPPIAATCGLHVIGGFVISFISKYIPPITYIINRT